MSSFASRLIRWQMHHGRHDLPWQGADAYRVWLSEIMLQQTQVATVIPYYQRFVASFPTSAALAATTEEQVLTYWSGLGYYARGRNLHAAAQLIVEKYQGEFPRELEQILELPGIGRSTAAAICALAYHERCAILDGNVKRVLARYCGIEGWAGDKKVEAQLWRQAEELLPPPSSRGNDIATYTQALMDMGATICTRSKPHCPACPVQADCIALQTNRIANLPALRPKKPLPEKHAVFLLLMHGNDILLEKRPSNGIWGGLWCPPQFINKAAALAWCAQRRIESVSGEVSNHERAGEEFSPFTHTFTHFKLHITPVLLRLKHKPQQVQQPGSMWLDMEEALRGAIPSPVRRILAGMKNAKKSLISSTHKNNWMCYLLECVDGTLYCGITNELEKRLASHNAGEGAKYTRGRAPVKLVYVERCANKSAALKREMEIKDLPRAEKLILCGLTEAVENR